MLKKLSITLMASVVSITTVGLTTFDLSAEAATFSFDLEAFLPDGSFGSGSFETIDPIGPNQNLSGPTTNVLSDITFTISNLNSTPNTTTFNIDDIPSIIFRTDASGNFSDFNIGVRPIASNTDYSAQGVQIFTFDLTDSSSNLVNQYEFTNIQEVTLPPTDVPEPASVLGLLTLGALGATSLKRK